MPAGCIRNAGLYVSLREPYDARRAGFGKLYLSTDHAGLYEKWGFRYIGQGYHPWDAESRIYERTL